MDRKILNIIIAILLPVSLAVSCGTSGSNKTAAREVWHSCGWVDDNSYRIFSSGQPSNDKQKSGKEQRRESAQKDAVLKAKASIIDTFCAVITGDGLSEYDPEFKCRECLKPRIKPVLESGRIVAERYNEETDDCEIIYEVRFEGLKKMVGSCNRWNDF